MQLVGGVVGAGIGTFFGAPQVGWAIGSMLGGMASRPPAPKTGSLAPTEVEYGWGIPIVKGTRRQPTWRPWQSALTAHPVEASKGGGSTVGYTYTCHMGLLICRRGPSAMVRIWRNKELAAVFRTDASEEDIARSLASRFWSSATFYDGAADQLPHPTYEAAYAPAAVPAYRGWCTLWLDDVACEGKTPPAIEVEVTTGPESAGSSIMWRLSIGGSNGAPGATAYGSNPQAVIVGRTSRFIYQQFGTTTESVHQTLQEAVAAGEAEAPNIMDDPNHEGISSGGAQLVSVSSVGGTVTYSYTVGVTLVQTFPGPGFGSVSQVVYPFTVVNYDTPLTFDAEPWAVNAQANEVSRYLPDGDGGQLCYGSSDVALAPIADYETGTLTIRVSDSLAYVMGGAFQAAKFVQRGNLFVGANGEIIRRFTVGGPDHTHELDLGSEVQGLATDGTNLWALSGSTITPLVADDLTSAGSTFTTPDSGARIFCNSDGDLYCYAQEVLYRRNQVDEEWVEVLDVTGTLFDGSEMVQPPGYEGGVLYAVQTGATSNSYVGVISLTTVAPEGVSLNSILSNYWQNCGIPSSMIDLTATAGIMVDGYTAEGSGKHVTDELATARFFETVNDGAGLKTVLRGQASVATIPYADCGVGVDEAKQEPIELDTDSAAEVPRRNSLSAANSQADHEVITETDDRLLGPNVATNSMSLAISMTPERLKGIVNTITADQKTAARQGKVALGLDWIDLELGDVVVLTGRQGETLRVRLVQESFADYVREFDWVLDRAADLQATGIVTAAAREPTLTVQGNPGAAVVVPIDGPLLRDADDAPGMYVGADLQGGAPSAVVFQSQDNGTYSSAAEVTTELVRGTLLTDLRGWNGRHQWDAVSTFDVLMADGGTLTSSTKAAMHADRTINACLIGSPSRGWELGRFVSAPLIAADTYRVTTMLRAMGGTEDLSYLHLPGETFILLRNDGSLLDVQAALAQAGTRYWKAVPPGRTLAATAAVASDFQSIRTKPLAPTFLRCTRDASGNATFTWTPRTRRMTRWEGAIFPDSEPAGTWRVEFFQHASFGTAVRTVTVSTASAEYTAAQQTADDVDDPARIAVRVRRVSAAGQLGYALEDIR